MQQNLTLAPSAGKADHAVKNQNQSCTDGAGLLSTINTHPRDARIAFDEPTHVYTIDGSAKGYKSVTTLVHTAFKPFVADEVVSNIFRGRNYAQSDYYGMSREEIKASWTEAAALGTAMHLNIEKFYNGQLHSTSGKEWELFQQYYKDHSDYKPFRTEMIIFAEDVKIAGSVDMIYFDPINKGKYIIADWKRSKEIRMNNKYQHGTLPCSKNLDDCNFNQYSLQLSIYKYILETKYDMEISECFLVILHPKQQNYLKISCDDLTEVVEELFDMRKQWIKEQDENKENIDDEAWIDDM